MRKRIATIALVLLLSASATMVAAQTAGIVFPQSSIGAVYPTSGLKIGDKAVYYAVAVFPGDKIQTGDMSALLTLEGVSVQMSPNSAIGVAAVPEFASGSAVVAASKPMILHVADREVEFSASSILKIENNGGMLSISVQSGAAKIKENGTVTTLLQGQSISRAVPVSSAQQSDAKTASKPSGAHPPHPGASTPLLKTKTFWLVAGGAAAGGVTAGVLATRGEGPVSPSVP